MGEQGFGSSKSGSSRDVSHLKVYHEKNIQTTSKVKTYHFFSRRLASASSEEEVKSIFPVEMAFADCICNFLVELFLRSRLAYLLSTGNQIRSLFAIESQYPSVERES